MKPALHIFAALPTASQSGPADKPDPQPAAGPAHFVAVDHNQTAVSREAVGSNDDFARAVAKLEAATAFLGSRYIENLIAQTVTVAVQRAASPFCDREEAAAYLLCDVSQIDRAAKAGVIKRHLRGGTPLFEKADLFEAVTSGRWAGK